MLYNHVKHMILHEVMCVSAPGTFAHTCCSAVHRRQYEAAKVIHMGGDCS